MSLFGPRLDADSMGLLREIKRRLGYVLSNQNVLFINQETIMAAADDLKAAIADLSTQLATNNAEIETLLGKITTPGATDAQVAEAVASIRGLIASNKAETDKAAAAAL